MMITRRNNLTTGLNVWVLHIYGPGDSSDKSDLSSSIQSVLWDALNAGAIFQCLWDEDMELVLSCALKAINFPPYFNQSSKRAPH